jgi:hypothetical protein
MGGRFVGAEIRPTVGSFTIDGSGTPGTWAPFWLNAEQTPGSQCVIVGLSDSSVCSPGVNDNALYVTGNVQTSGDVRGTIFRAVTSLVVGSTTAISINTGSVRLGSLTFPTTLPGTSGQFLKSNGDNTISWGDGTLTNGVTAAGTLTSGDIVTGAGTKTIQTDSSLSISTKIEATKTIHTTLNVEVATSVLTSAGAGTITIPAVTGNMMIDTTYLPRLR